MKKFLAILVMLITLLTFGACEISRTVDTEGDFTVVVDGETDLVYSIKLEDLDLSKGALSILLYLQETEGLNLVYENSTYGAYITEVGGLKTDSNGYVSLFTSYQPEWDVTEWCVKAEYNGVEVATAAVGVSSMSVIKGEILYIKYVSYAG